MSSTEPATSDLRFIADLEGGCLCGALRYAVRGEALFATLCHCSLCRRAAGAPVVGWAMFPLDAVRFERGKPAVYASSPAVERGFCAGCGTTLSFTADFLPGLIDLTIASFDEPERLPPQLHMWERKRIPWLELGDELPRYAELPPQAS
jgi:hypothetical protein